MVWVGVVVVGVGGMVVRGILARWVAMLLRTKLNLDIISVLRQWMRYVRGSERHTLNEDVAR